MHGKVLIVAGSDSSGGAGIQADIKTVTALGGYAMTAITALTAQNTTGVQGIHAVPADFVGAQLEAVLKDLPPDAVKAGMLANVDIVHVLRAALANVSAPFVLDPVMTAASGNMLIDETTATAIKETLFPIAALVTPNVAEAEFLLGRPVRTASDQDAAAHELLDWGAEAVLLKGGHIEGTPVRDVLVTAGGARHVFTTPRIETPHTHGTGCTLASAIAAGLAQGLLLEGAVDRARRYLEVAIRTNPGFGHGAGPVNHGHTVQDFA